ncbi:LysR family transcriptional regulator [Vibrio gallicus]|uniref:LysR family transcriptional regulator n=1 Tax=Vibrio gallicus TaxID=190897 RepID=UPI0021C3690E|nr:LysR family transcriptional regulator [Vibrio gallicus]
MDWIQSIRSYVMVVEEGSFNGAARRMSTTSSAVSKRIHWLEDRVGTQLLKRTTRNVTQTEAGALFYKRMKQSLANFQSIIDETRSVNEAPVGLLRIGATLAVGAKFLLHYIDGFLQLYPDIRIQLITTVPGQLPEMSLDLFISREIEQLNSLSFRSKRLFEDKFRFYAAPSYLEKYGEPKSIEALQQHNILMFSEQLQREFTLVGGKRISVSGNFATTNPEALFHAGKNGMGILPTNSVMIQQELKQGILVPILPEVYIKDMAIYAYYPKLDYEHTRTRLFLDYLQQQLSLRNE